MKRVYDIHDNQCLACIFRSILSPCAVLFEHVLEKKSSRKRRKLARTGSLKFKTELKVDEASSETEILQTLFSANYMKQLDYQLEISIDFYV